MATYNRILFERLIQSFDTLFDYNLQEGLKLKILNINIIQSEHGIIIDQTDYIINKSPNNIVEQIQRMK